MLRWLAIAFAAGLSTGMLTGRRFTAEWVSAVGTWVGAVATIATIVWAVRSFQQESQNRVEDLERAAADKRAREAGLAEAVLVRCAGGGGEGMSQEDNTWTLTSVNVRITNGAVEPVTIVSFDVPGLTLKQNPMRIIPETLQGGQIAQHTIDIRDRSVRVGDDEISNRNPLKKYSPVLVYRIGGITWQRTGNRRPVRL